MKTERFFSISVIPSSSNYTMFKVIVNVGGEPGAWMEPVGMDTEIVPLAKPYDRWTGNVFQGKVLLNGKPVPGAEIE